MRKESTEEGISKLIDASIQCGVERFIYLSSIKAGGPVRKNGIYIREENRTPIDIYGSRKRQEEELLRKSEEYLPWVALRIPAVFGSLDKKSLLLFQITNHCIVPILPERHASRFSMIHIDQVIYALEKTLSDGIEMNRIYEIADGSPVTWNDLVKWLSRTRSVQIPVPVTVLRWAIKMGRTLGILEQSTATFIEDRINDVSQYDWMVLNDTEDLLALHMKPVDSLQYNLICVQKDYVRVGWL